VAPPICAASVLMLASMTELSEDEPPPQPLNTSAAADSAATLTLRKRPHNKPQDEWIMKILLSK
jgi:hypothetical protein